MASIYVDPSASTNGSGTEASPRNIWPTSIGAGDVIYLKRGTTLIVSAQLSLGGGSNNEVRDYGSGELPIITSSASNFGQINVDRSGVTTFRNIWFKDCRGGAANGGVIVASPVAAARVANLAIYGCKFTNCSYNAIRLNGTNTATAASTFVCKFCTFDGIGEDCVFGAALDYEFAYNTCTNLSSGTVTGDGVGYINADPTRIWIHHNYIDHSAVDCKQCIIVDTTTPGTGVSIIEDNVLIGYGSASVAPSLHTVIISDPVTTIRRNIIYTYGLTCGVNFLGDSVTDNLFVVGNCESQVTSMVADGIIAGNTFVATSTLDASSIAVTMGSGATSAARVRNNLFVGMPIAIQSNVVGQNPTVGNNAYWNVTTPRLGSSGAFSESNAVTSDPQLAYAYRPKYGSPLIGAGTHLGYTRDVERKQRANPPTIGAYDAATLREA